MLLAPLDSRNLFLEKAEHAQGCLTLAGDNVRHVQPYSNTAYWDSVEYRSVLKHHQVFPGVVPWPNAPPFLLPCTHAMGAESSASAEKQPLPCKQGWKDLAASARGLWSCCL